MATNFLSFPAPKPTPRLLIVVIHENDKTDSKWLERHRDISCPLSIHSDISHHSLNFSPDMFQHPSSFLDPINLSNKVKELTKHVEDELAKYNNPGKLKPLVLLIGLGFGALVAMEAVDDKKPELFTSHNDKIIPVGMVLSLVTPKSKTGRSSIFQRWYNTLQDDKNKDDKKKDDKKKDDKNKDEKDKDDKNKDMDSLLGLFQRFDGLCRKHHIRVSFITWQEPSEKDLISKHMRCARRFVEEQGNNSKATDQKLFILWEHINRSWPKHLLQLIQHPKASEAEIKDVLLTHRGELSHEPDVAEVLQMAAAENKLAIVEDLLKYKVHPDVRLGYDDPTAFESSKPMMQDKLYIYGAKEYSPNPRFRFWPDDPEKMSERKEGVECQDQSSNCTNSRKTKKNERGEKSEETECPDQPRNPINSSNNENDEMGKNKETAEHRGESHNTSDKPNGKDKPQFRALVVDIYYPEPKRASNNKQAEKQDNFPKTPNASFIPEFHSIAHPTVEDLIYEKGPSEIMRMYRPKSLDGLEFGQYKRTRWIHLPMNHMTWLSELVKKVCTEKCKDLNDNTNEDSFPRLPECEDALFDYHYWLGHQSTRGTEEHSHIRHLQPQFRRLGMKYSKRTGFMVALPYVHFDTYGEVLKLKNKAAELKKLKTKLTDPRYPLRLTDAEKTWETETETGGGASGESDDIENEKIWIDSQNKVPSTTLGVIQKDLYSALPVHYRRTLSQFSFNSNLQRTKQVVTEHFEKNWPDREPLVLMVDQLWMLVLVDGTIITCFPSQMGGSQQLFPYIYTDLVEGLLNSLRSEWRSPIESVLDVGYIIIQECIGFLFNQRARHNVCFRFLNIYEQQLSEMAASEAGWFEQLSDIVARLPDTSDKRRYELDAQDCLESLLKLDKEMKIIAEINKLKHIRRELGVLLEVVATQVKVVKQVTDELESSEEFHWKEFTDSSRLKSRRQRRARKLEARSQILTNLDNKAESILHNLELFVTRKEQQVQNLQSYFSSRLADRSSRMEVIILVLTGVTTVFAPLSLITAFLALQITEFPHDPTGENVSMPLSFAGKWVFGVGLPVFVFIALIAFAFIARTVDFSPSLHRLWQALSTAGNSVHVLLVCLGLAKAPTIAPGEDSDDVNIDIAPPEPTKATPGHENGKMLNFVSTITTIMPKSSKNSGSGDPDIEGLAP